MPPRLPALGQDEYRAVAQRHRGAAATDSRSRSVSAVDVTPPPAPYDVTAVAVSPGSTDTAMLRATADLYDATTDDLAAHQLLRRALRPDEVAATLVFCCSREAAVLNGSVVSADGGFQA